MKTIIDECAVQLYTHTQLTSYLHDIYPDMSSVEVYFDPSDTSGKKIGEIYIKPVLLFHHGSILPFYPIYVQYKDIINLFSINHNIAFNEEKIHNLDPNVIDSLLHSPKCIVNKNIELTGNNEKFIFSFKFMHDATSNDPFFEI